MHIFPEAYLEHVHKAVQPERVLRVFLGNFAKIFGFFISLI